MTVENKVVYASFITDTIFAISVLILVKHIVRL